MPTTGVLDHHQEGLWKERLVRARLHRRTRLSYRLDDPDADAWAREFFRSLYEFAAGEWQDQTDTADEAGTPSGIGERSFIMHPDHPSAARF
jgi:hypothetical protein